LGNPNPKPYAERTDQERIQSQWNKLNGHQYRGDWSAAVVRAATAAEIAVNFAIRKEFAARSQLDGNFVDGLLRWANGIGNKFDKLLVPIVANEKRDEVKTLAKLAKAIHEKRNAIAHSGEFASKKEFEDARKKCRDFVVGLLKLYDANFDLKDRVSEQGEGELDP
jgi:hypothetical protein